MDLLASADFARAHPDPDVDLLLSLRPDLGVRDSDDFTRRTLARYCRDIGCTESNTVAAVLFAWAQPECTAVRDGQKRARQLRERQAPPRVAA